MTHQNQTLEWAERLKVGLHGVWRMAAQGWGERGGGGGRVVFFSTNCMYSLMVQADSDWVDSLKALREMFGEKVTSRRCWRCSGTASNTLTTSA